MPTGIRLSGATITKIKAEIDRYFDTYMELEESLHECGEGCSENCEREVDIIGARVLHPTHILIEDFIERIIEAL